MGDAARALIGSPRTRPALLIALALALYLAPFAVGTEYRLFIATQIAAYVLVAIWLNLLNRYGRRRPPRPAPPCPPPPPPPPPPPCPHPAPLPPPALPPPVGT